MPKLTLTFKQKSLGDFLLNKGHSLTIGRRRNNDIMIENLAVSSHHAKIDSVGDGFVLLDLQSKNGSFVNEQLISSHWLKNGDVISIGKHSLIFSYSDGEEVPGDNSDEIERTMVMDTSKYRSMVNKSKPTTEDKKSKSEPDEPAVRVTRKNTIGILTYLNGDNGKLKVRDNVIKIGKHSESDIIVKGFMMGSTAATISRGPDGFCLTHEGGMVKPKVNNKKVKRFIILNDEDVIDIGNLKLQFFERKPRRSKDKPSSHARPTSLVMPE